MIRRIAPGTDLSRTFKRVHFVGIGGVGTAPRQRGGAGGERGPQEGAATELGATCHDYSAKAAMMRPRIQS